MTSITTQPRSVQPRVRGWAEKFVGGFTLVLVLALWQLLSTVGYLPTDSIPSAIQVFKELFWLLFSGGFWENIWATVSASLIGLLFVVVVGSILAIIIGTVRSVDKSTWFMIEFLKPIPPIALIPLGLLLWGPSPTMKITLIAFGSLWPFLTQMIYGIRQTDNVVMDMAASYRLGWKLTTTRIIVPGLLPYALTGLRISASIAVIVSVVTELVGGANGIGQTIAASQANGILDTMYAYIITAGLLGVAINLIFGFLEKPLLFWHPSHREVNN